MLNIILFNVEDMATLLKLKNSRMWHYASLCSYKCYVVEKQFTTKIYDNEKSFKNLFIIYSINWIYYHVLDLCYNIGLYGISNTINIFILKIYIYRFKIQLSIVSILLLRRFLT